MSPEQQVVKVNELQLCLVCMKHTKGRADFQGCSKSGCWALILARLFKVQVAAESYPPGSQIFQLGQRIKMAKLEVGLTFDGGSSHTVITGGFAKEET
jgi:hypothetical protein